VSASARPGRGRRAPRAALAAAALLALAGCRTVPRPELPPLPPDDPRPAALLERAAALAAGRSALRASARVSMSGRRGEAFTRQLVLLERPARLRLEVLGVLGQRVVVLATDGSHYDLYRAERPAIESGEVHPGILYEVAGIAVTPEEAVRLALGSPFAPGDAAPAPDGTAALPDGAVRVALRAREGDLRRTLEFAPTGELRRFYVHDPAGARLLDVRYADFREVGGSPFAHAIEVELPLDRSRAAIQLRDVELNPALSDDWFRLRLARESSARPAWRSAAR
jgi:hypothetical protein